MKLTANKISLTALLAITILAFFLLVVFKQKKKTMLAVERLPLSVQLLCLHVKLVQLMGILKPHVGLAIKVNQK
ncbi:hypothetical protein ACX5HH_003252 [Providencia stuartii]|uniref:hypothetical protein n=1 Tax=Providencia stuartii TaxID=588 RepID=UPI0011AB45CB|nr:hypothetical protein [Providencia stuartii]